MRNLNHFAKNLFVLLLFLVPVFSFSQENPLNGEWRGTIEIPGMSLEVIFHFEQSASGIKGSLDIPMQNAKGLELKDVVLQGSKLEFSLPDVPGNASFSGELLESGNEIKGKFKQSGMEFPMEIRKKSLEDQLAEKERLESALADFMALADSMRVEHHVAGMGISIVHKGNVVYEGGVGYRDVEKKLPVGAQTQFAIGSSTKAFTALCLALLVEEGKLEWEEPVKKYMTDFGMHDAFADARINAIDLLSHRSGLPRHDFSWYGAEGVSRDELLGRIKHLPPNKEFRTSWQYQNFMFLAAGVLAERISGMSWEEMVKQRIFKPLEMSNSNLSVAVMQKRADRALGYRYDKDKDSLILMPYKDLDAMGPAGSINSCPADMSKWLRFQLNKGKVGDSAIISSSALDFTHSPKMLMGPSSQKEITGKAYALGWMTYQYKGKRVVEHGGNIDGFSAQVFLLPDEDFGICILSNENGTPVPSVLCNYAMDMFMDLERTDWNERRLKTPEKEEDATDEEQKSEEEKAMPIAGTNPSRALDQFVGEYFNPGYGTANVSLRDDKLHLKYNSLDHELKHWHYDVYAMEMEDLGITFKWQFQSGIDGEIENLIVNLELMSDPVVFKKRAPARLSDPRFISKLIGEYEMESMVLKIEQGPNNTLRLKPTGQDVMQLEAWRGNEYRLKSISGFSIEFELGADGMASELILKQPNGVFRAKRMQK